MLIIIMQGGTYFTHKDTEFKTVAFSISKYIEVLIKEEYRTVCSTNNANN